MALTGMCPHQAAQGNDTRHSSISPSTHVKKAKFSPDYLLSFVTLPSTTSMKLLYAQKLSKFFQFWLFNCLIIRSKSKYCTILHLGSSKKAKIFERGGDTSSLYTLPQDGSFNLPGTHNQIGTSLGIT